MLIFDLSRIFQIAVQSGCFFLFSVEYLVFIYFLVMSDLVPPMTGGRKKKVGKGEVNSRLDIFFICFK